MATATHTDTASVLTNLDEATLKLLGNYKIHQTPTGQTEDSDELAPRTVQVTGVLRQARDPAFDPTLAPHPMVPYPVETPDWWESRYRMVPDYRPVNRELDREERRQSLLFTAVGTFMIAGCSLIAVG
ncbi:hypothetical protein BDW66DRAFT_155819 [Aspergillus desertorum]